jgi:hypothetical protein
MDELMKKRLEQGIAVNFGETTFVVRFKYGLLSPILPIAEQIEFEVLKKKFGVPLVENYQNTEMNYQINTEAFKQLIKTLREVHNFVVEVLEQGEKI